MNSVNKLVHQIKYRSDIDGLRAVLAVVLHHLSPQLIPGGYIGVDVFFVISGYLITGIINREIAEGQFTFKRFYQRRIRRIFPALFLMMASSMVVGYFILLPSDYAATLRAVLGTLFFSSNMVFWRDMAAGYFAATDSRLNPLLHTWSLGVEEQFYVVFPVLLLICNRYFSKYTVGILVVGALLTLAASALLVESKSVAVFFLSPFRAWELLAGALLTYNILPAPRNQMQREILAWSGLLAILGASFWYSSKTTFPGLAAIAPVFGAVAIIHAGSSGATFVARLLQLRPVVYIGLISYSLYLWHWPLIVFTGYIIGMKPLTPYLPALFISSLLLASFSYHFVEQPFRHSGTITRKIVFALAAVFSLILASVSVVGLVKNGFANRFEAKVIKLDEARYPDIPFVECDSRSDGKWCHLGSASAEATTLVWGDSHALAWGPVLDASLRESGMSALFAANSACPPLLSVDNTVKPMCLMQNNFTKNYLLSHPEITTVMMAAYWSTYFKEDGPLIWHSDSTVKGTIAAREALEMTVKWLEKHGKRVVLIGPVPVYDKSVPQVIAREAASHRDLSELTYSSLLEQRRKHAPFFDVVESIEPSYNFHFLSPIEWMCTEECDVMIGGLPLYRDAHHLSVAGAMLFKSHFDDVLKNSVIVK